MKNNTEKKICMIPIVIWVVIIPLIVKAKFFVNPLSDYSWYSSEQTLADFFLYYKSLFVTITGAIMIVVLCWQISKMRKKDTLINRDMWLFLPALIYLVLAVFSSLFSEYRYFCTHGMPDQFETIWNLIAYVVALFYCYYAVVYQQSEKTIFSLIFIGVTLVSIICVLQFLKIDIYRIIYTGKGYSFTFEEGTVYGPFYNINYVGFYTLLFVPLFILLCIFSRDLKTRIVSCILSIALLISMWGAKSSTSIIALVGVIVFTIFFFMLKNVKEKKILWIPIALLITGAIGVCVITFPRIGRYLQLIDTEKTELENIFTNDNNVEIDYKGEKLYIHMLQSDGLIYFVLVDQNQDAVDFEYAYADNGYYYTVADERFAGMTLTPVLISENPTIYGFDIEIDGRNWCFTDQLTEDGSYMYYNDLGKCTKLTPESVSSDFEPLVHMTYLASGRGYIWNKTIALLKDYIFLGSGADTFTMVYPNDDFVDKYNNGYDNMITTKPHNLYLQIAIQSGVLSLICFMVFYMWYVISSLCLYFRQRFNNLLTVTGFAILLGTIGYMISALANDSTITVAPLYWAMLGVGIGINHRIRNA